VAPSFLFSLRSVEDRKFSQAGPEFNLSSLDGVACPGRNLCIVHLDSKVEVAAGHAVPEPSCVEASNRHLSLLSVRFYVLF